MMLIDASLGKSQDSCTEHEVNTQQQVNDRLQNQSSYGATGNIQVRCELMSPCPGDGTCMVNPQSGPVGSCITARRRHGRTQPGQDPLSYRIGTLWFNTFRAMDPANGCICLPSQLPRCNRPCKQVLEMRRENYLNSLRLMQMPEEQRRKMIGNRDPATVLIARAYKYNAKFMMEKCEQNQQYVFEEMTEIDSIARMMQETHF